MCGDVLLHTTMQKSCQHHDDIMMLVFFALYHTMTCHHPLLLLALGEGRKGGCSKKISTTESAKEGLQFPVGCIGCCLKQGKYATQMGAGTLVYLDSLLEYSCDEILELAGNTVHNN